MGFIGWKALMFISADHYPQEAGKRPSTAEGLLLPNFENSREPTTLGKALAPVGFGAIAAHWAPRSSRAGTYDASWKEQRAPLPPADFDARFHNVAPDDQQLEVYPGGQTITLTNMTLRRQESLVLPALTFPMSFVDDGYLVDREARPDTVVIDLNNRLVTLRAAVEYVPSDSLLDVTAVFVGELSAEQRTSLLAGISFRRW